MPKVTVSGSGETVFVEGGTTLMQAARQLGISLDAPCGGEGKCGKCRATVNGIEALACQYPVLSDVTVEFPQVASHQILTGGQTAEISADPLRPGFLAAFDIGTTTLVCFLLSPEGRELAVESVLNPQIACGADVMSRIRHALSGQLDTLTMLIRGAMASLLDKCCHTAGITPKQIGVISVVGNPCMQQLFLNISPENLAQVPFPPVLTEARTEEAAACFPGCENAVLLTVPDISGYIGADTLGCILASRLYEAKDTVLLVDIGTNGEMVLAHGGRMAACSTAAGPALEGAGIQWGMRGQEGAIDRVWRREGQLHCHVIGGGEALGICGSGIIDATAALLDAGLLTHRGRLLSAMEEAGQRIVKLSGRVFLTQEDIRQVQLAKGAIAAGIHLLCAHFGISPGEIDRVILAGAFGSYLDPRSACRIGLLPRELAGRITAAGNLAGVGAKLLALDKKLLPFSQTLRNQTEHLELAQLPAFRRTFARCMGFADT